MLVICNFEWRRASHHCYGHFCTRKHAAGPQRLPLGASIHLLQFSSRQSLNNKKIIPLIFPRICSKQASCTRSSDVIRRAAHWLGDNPIVLSNEVSRFTVKGGTCSHKFQCQV